MVSLISKGVTVLQVQIMVVVVFSQGQLGFHLSCGTVKLLFYYSVLVGELRAFSRAENLKPFLTNIISLENSIKINGRF